LLVAIGGKVVIFFIGHTSLTSALEAAGAFIALLTGFYYFAQVFLMGAIVSRVYAHRYGSMREVNEAHGSAKDGVEPDFKEMPV
jgi:membrane protein